MAAILVISNDQDGRHSVPHLYQMTHLTKHSCINVLFHYTQKLSHDLWFQITKQILRKTRFKLEHGVTFGKGQIITLTFDINIASLNRLV